MDILPFDGSMAIIKSFIIYLSRIKGRKTSIDCKLGCHHKMALEIHNRHLKRTRPDFAKIISFNYSKSFFFSFAQYYFLPFVWFNILVKWRRETAKNHQAHRGQQTQVKWKCILKSFNFFFLVEQRSKKEMTIQSFEVAFSCKLMLLLTKETKKGGKTISISNGIVKNVN